MLPDEVREAVDTVRVALNDWTATYASEFCDESTVEAARKRISERGTLAYICDALGAIESIRAHLLAREAEVERLQARVEREESDCLEVIQERDWAQDCLQKAHIALGGDGEWTCKMPSPEPPDSGDLHYDVPALAEEVRARAERADALLRECLAVMELHPATHNRITAHLGAEQ